MIYLITYDLNKESSSKDYPKLYETIEEFGNNIHLMDSVWLISSDKTAKEILNSLKIIADENDFIFITKIPNKNYSSNVDKINNTDWIENEKSSLWD